MIDSNISQKMPAAAAAELLTWMERWSEWLDLLLATGSYSPSPMCRAKILNWARDTSDLGWHELAQTAVAIAQGEADGEPLTRAHRTRQVLRLLVLHAITERALQGQQLLRPTDEEEPE